MAESLPPMYSYSPQYKMVICRDCRKVIRESNLLGHLSQSHLLTSHQIESQGYKAAIEDLVLQTIPEVYAELERNQPVPVIQELEVLNAQRCLQCGELYRSRNKALRHVREQHGVSGIKRQSAHLEDCEIQCLLPNGYFFQVQSVEPNTRDAVTSPRPPARLEVVIESPRVSAQRESFATESSRSRNE